MEPRAGPQLPPTVTLGAHSRLGSEPNFTLGEGRPLRLVAAGQVGRLGGAPVRDLRRQRDRELVVVVRRPMSMAQLVNMEAVAQRLAEAHRVGGGVDRV